MHAIQCAERHSDPTEHRWGQRVTLEVPVKLDVGGRTMGHGVLRNASVSGAFIETALELPMYTNLLVTLPTARQGEPGCQALVVCVVRREPGGIAVEWRDMACPSIIALLERATGRPVTAMLEDEAFTQRRASC